MSYRLTGSVRMTCALNMRSIGFTLIASLAALSMGLSLSARARSAATRRAFADPNGVLRWQDDKREVALFGVNYYPPFAIDYNVLEDRKIDHKAAIRQDVAHFVRLGLSSIRLHCWDREISDRQGNLVDNVHVDLLDYLLARCKDNGIYALLTPIAWWQSATGKVGFSNFWSMPEMTSNPDAWKAQTNYLRQFVNHVNRYTGLAYRDDPGIIAFETINEPIYPPGLPDAKVVEYIDTLVRAIRSTGCRKPVFHSYFCNRLKAVGASEADGITFGWYPSGLASGRTLTANFLSQVSDYPGMRDPALASKIKAVYEFDAADIHSPYIYPAIARTFRTGGCQIANQFQYEPLCIGAWNRNWQTHYLNLCYTPNKAISFAIAAEVFRRVPRGRQFGGYPENSRFGSFRVSYEEHLSELAADDAFLYSNNTGTRPPAPEKLTRVWGCGSSPIVTYGGTGAYFLDKQQDHTWTLDVYPDAVVVADPYTGGLNEKVRILWCPHEMTVRLPGLGPLFHVSRTTAPAARAESADGRFTVSPGQYVLSTRDDVRVSQPPFIAPPASNAPPAVRIEAPDQWREGTPMPVRTSVACPGVRSCTLFFRSPDAKVFAKIATARIGPYHWRTDVPETMLDPGIAGYYLSIEADRTYWFPGGRTEPPMPAKTRPPVSLMTVRGDAVIPKVSYGGPKGKTARARIVPGRDKGKYALRIEADGFGPPPSCAGIRRPADAVPRTDLSDCNAVRFLVRGDPNTAAVEIGLPQKDGNAFGWNVPVCPVWNEVTVPLRKLHALWSTKSAAPDPAQIEEVSIIFGAWLMEDVADRPHWIEVQSVELVPRTPRWEVRVLARTAPVVLLSAATHPVRLAGGRYRARAVAGMDRDVRAVRFSVTGFDPAPDCRSLKVPVESDVPVAKGRLAHATHVVLKARAGTPRSKAVELVLIEKDGAPWGTVVPLTSEWRAIRIPLSSLRYFKHWNPPCQNRGGPNDRFHPDNVGRVSLCFGAFLYPDTFDRPQAIEIQDVSLTGDGG